ncbi:MAG: IPT/TIG domain-containing protein [Candidatus Acidiferrales bacterium]
MRHFILILFLVTAAALSGCTGSTKGASNSGGSTSNSTSSGIAVSVSPNTASVRTGATQSFSASVSGSSNTSVSWQVNGVTGGSASTGIINSSGVYTAPASIPNSGAVTVQAVSAANASASGSSTVTLLNPAPVLNSITPASVSSGAFTITVNGSGFVSGAQVVLAGTPLTTIFMSSTQLTASGSAASAGTFAVTVTNPNPGSATSNAQNLQVTSGSSTGNPPPTCSVMSLGQSASLNGFVPFPADNLWNKDISAASVDPNSTAIINFIGAGIGLHPDFGSGLYNGQSIGIPYLVVGSQQAPLPVTFTAYGSESDPGPIPIPVTALVEGYPVSGSGDDHVLVLDNNNCWLYELYNAVPGTASWNAGSAAVWDLTVDGQRPYTWTSADAAGLPIFPGLARYDEVASGQINHALRFTLQSSQAAFIPPASHWAANSTNALAAPMGMRLRLKASVDISSFSTANQVILNALKKYGMIMADNGSSMYISGAPDDNWNNSDLHNLGSITAADFEVIQMTPLYTAANIPTGANPSIASFTANSQLVSAGTPVMLSWNVTGASYVIVSPGVGAVRGTSVSVMPTQSTTYTLYVTNAFGRSTATINITVH